MYLKIITSLSLLISAVSVGYFKAEELKRRVKWLEEFKKMVVLIQGELRFHRATLTEAFENIFSRLDEPFSGMLKKMTLRMSQKSRGSFRDIWNEEGLKLVHTQGLQKADEQLFLRLGSNMGYLDLEMQLEHLNLIVIQTDELIYAAKEQQSIKGRLYQTMGVTVGALLVLLII